MKVEKSKSLLVIFCLIIWAVNEISAQNTISVRPREIDDVLINPGIGFITFGRFNSDDSVLKDYSGENHEYNRALENKDYPMTSIAFFRFDWNVTEPEMGKYNWPLIDNVLKTAHESNHTLMLRIAPYADGPDRDVPAWYRALVGEEDSLPPKWRINPEDPEYYFYFGRIIAELAGRYDGHPDIEAIDLSIVGFWGEGSGSASLSQKTRELLVNAYTNNFKKTPLLILLTEKTNKYILTQANEGWRADCTGDLDF